VGRGDIAGRGLRVATIATMRSPVTTSPIAAQSGDRVRMTL